jgi:DNA-binding NtrC family response regulator
MNGHQTHSPIGRILFVDQDIAMGKVLELILTNDRFQLVTVSSAEKGLEQMTADKPFDFVISGYTLPGMNGLRFLRQASELYQKSVRILMSGGYADSDEVSLAIREGHISRYVSKPFCYATFREDINNDFASISVGKTQLDYNAS